MLVLGRRPNESIIINDDIIVSILGVIGSLVRVGIEAPKTVTVHRDEIYKKIMEEKRLKSRNYNKWDRK